jgi:two-component system OmpR family sensor kinase
MFSGLRARLLISYTAVIALVLCAVTFALLLILRDNPITVRQEYQVLATIARATAPFVEGSPEQVDRRLSAIAEANNIRALRVGEGGVILFDSAGALPVGQPIALRAVSEGALPRGTYRDGAGRRWMYVVAALPQASADLGRVIYATPVRSFAAINLMEETLLGPLFRIGVSSLIVSFVLAVVIASSVSRPLRRAVDAAHAIAEGDYTQQVEERGPREVRELAEAFNHMAGQVQQSRQAQRDFLANVSHELKTPLTSIQGFSQAILDGAAAEPERAARVIYDEAGRLHRLVEDLLDLARIESGQTPLRREHVDLQTLLDGILEGFALRAGEKSITLAHQLVDLPRLTGDNDRLAQVFTNLIDNALAHTPGGGQIGVRARHAPRPGGNQPGVEITVSDSGPGIPPEDLSRIFERFYQVDKSRSRTQRAGSGLGLAITKEIVEAHGGLIRAESAAGQGATFIVWLPAPQPSDETVARPISPLNR